MMSVMKKILFVFCFALIGIVSVAQNISVKGTVKDVKGDPLVGVAVMLEGNTTVGTVTDVDGKYQLSIPSAKNQNLVFTSIGYKEKKVAVAGKAVVDVELEEDTTMLEETVVVGYGAMRRSDITGALTSVKIDDETAAKSNSIDQMLEGRAAGVQVLSSSSSPDAGVTIRVRGIASFSGNTDPLYVVDGVIVDGAAQSVTTMSVGSFTNAVEQTNGLAGINPQDIASIEILKDASATAIYGSQGANGVVLITTKSASRDVPVIRFNAGVTVSVPGSRVDMMNFDEYVDYLSIHPDLAAQSALKNIYTDPENRQGLKVTPVDWQDYVSRTAVGQRYYLSISGRPKQTSYFFSLGYTHSEGVIKRTNSDNITASLNLQKDITRNLTVRFKTNFGFTKSDLVTGSVSGGNVTSRSSVLRSALRAKPLVYRDPNSAIEDETMTDTDSEMMYGPDRLLAGTNNTSERYRVIPSLSLDWKITTWLTFKSALGGELNTEERIKTREERISVGNGNIAGIGDGKGAKFNFDNTLTAKKSWKKHNLTFTLGQSSSMNTYSSESVTGWNLPQKYAYEQDINNAISDYSQIDAYTRSRSTLLSFFARGIYNYGDRYILTATARYDGSSKFQGKNKWGFFPSLAFAWRLTGEPWFNVPVISNAKLRLGWGQVGNQAISNYQTTRTFASGMLGSHINDSGKEAITYQSNLNNPDLKWETSDQLNLGLDLSLWRGRLTLTADAYSKKTRDLLQSKNVAISTGIASMYVNDGVIRNDGLEITVEGVPVKRGSLEWILGGNISFNRNTVVSIGSTGDRGMLFLDPSRPAKDCSYFYGSAMQTSGDTNPLNIFIEGQPMGLFYGYKTDGIVQADETDVPGFSEGAYLSPGQIKYKDLNGNGYIDVGDRTIIGNPLPLFTYGFNTSLSYRGFTLAVAFSGAYGFDIFNMNNIQDYETSYQKNVRREAVKNAWSPTNPSNEWPAIGEIDTRFSDRYVEDGSYLRLSDLSLGYNVPLSKKSKVLHGLNISVAAGNLLVWTKYSGYSPFSNSFGSNVKRMGVDLNSAPYPKSVSLDLKFTF